MNLDELIKAVMVYDAHLSDLWARLDEEKPGTEEYGKIRDDIDKLEGTKQKAIDGYVKVRNSLIPDFAVAIGTSLLAALLGFTILHKEETGTVIGSTATSLFNKLRF